MAERDFQIMRCFVSFEIIEIISVRLEFLCAVYVNAFI